VAAPAHGRIVSVFAAKGGCGKTTLATNLAVVLSEGGERRVCLLDLDLTFGDVAGSLRLEPRRSLVDAVPKAGELDVLAIRSVVTPFAEGLDCILAPVRPGESELVSAGLVGELLAELTCWYDYVVIDTPAQFSPPVLAALDSSHHHVLLTTSERPALTSLRLTLDMLDLLSYERESRSIVFNRCDSSVGLSAAEVERVVKSPIAGHIPSSRDVPASINRGEPLATAQPDHPVSRAIRTFVAAHLIPTRKGNPNVEANP
jgi:MinD-like ATPase involved in chromosome partitioning or flagellar assembly